MTGSEVAANGRSRANGKPRRTRRTKRESPAEPAGCEDTASAPETAGRAEVRSKAELVSDVIEEIEQRLTRGELKPTVGDFIRLLQLERELQEEQPREIKVTWVEPAETDCASAK